jgi:hypothetical protein
LAERDRALGIVAQGQARDPEIGRFLLHAARIRERETRGRQCRHKLDIAERRRQPQSFLGFKGAEQSRLLERTPRAGMERQHDWQATRDAQEPANERHEPVPIVDIARPMQGCDREFALKAMSGRPLRGRDILALQQQLLGSERRRHGGIHIVDHTNPVRSVGHANTIICEHDGGRLFRMTASADTKRVIRLGQFELPQDVGYLVVVLLAGVDDRHVEPIRSSASAC